MLNWVKGLDWVLICFVLTILRGVVFGFNLPIALIAVAFFALIGVRSYLEQKKSSSADNDLAMRVSSIESKLTLISTTRRNNGF